MKRSLLSAAAACALVASASVAQAQNMSPVKFGVSGGVALPSGDLSKGFSSGYNVAGHLGFMAPMFPAGLRADVAWNKFGQKNNSGVDFSILSGTLNGVFNLSAGMPASPYLLAGLGMYRGKSDMKNCPPTFTCSNTSTDFGLNGGLGMKFNLSGFSTFAEVRYHYVMSKDSKVPSSRNTAFIPISFGIMF